MTLHLRHLQLRAVSSGREYGADIEFADGLNIIRADNSSGKSTCMQAVIYALGLEGMLSPRRVVPLPHAMTDSIEIAGSDLPVEESWVTLEIENASGDRLQVRRAVKSASANQALIQASRYSADSTVSRRDYFVRRAGAAQREAGFHFELARFLGWRLPNVTRNDGSEGTLYLECLFPYFFVEQKHGWSGIQARIPTYFQIRDVSKRSAEYILGLDAYDVVLRRQRIEAAAGIMRTEWRQVVDRLRFSARSRGAVVTGLADQPPTAGVEVAELVVVMPRGETWVPLDEEISLLRSQIHEFRGRERTVGQAAPDLEQRLAEAEAQLTAVSAVLTESLKKLEETQARRNSLELRVVSLTEDLQRHRDAALLRRLGSTESLSHASVPRCPTCEQDLPDGFEITRNPMTEEQNIAFIEQEVRTYRAMQSDIERVLEAEEIQVARLREESGRLRRTIRTIKDSLVAPESLPSAEEAAEQLRIDERLESLVTFRDETMLTLEELRDRATRLAENRAALADLSEGESQRDQVKLAYLGHSFVDQLRAYGFSSLEPESLEISRETYRPIHEGFDLGFDLSASDMVRVIWSYLLAILETSRKFATNHPMLLMFDEPRQQETNRLSFQALLERAGRDGAEGAQIVFATSEEEHSLTAMLENTPHTLLSFPRGSKILRAL